MFKKLKEKIKKIRVSFEEKFAHHQFCKCGMEEALNKTTNEFIDFISTEWDYATEMAEDLLYGKTKSRKKIELVLLYDNFFTALQLAVETYKKDYFKEAVRIYNDIKEIKQIIRK